MNAYLEIEKRNARILRLSHLLSIAYWDEAVMMPEGGGEARSKAMSELRVMMSEMMHSQDYADLFSDAESKASILTSEWQQRNLEISKREWWMENCLSPAFVEKKSLATMKSEQAWRKARTANDWQSYLPFLEEVFALTKQEAELKSQKLGLSPYDSLLEMYSPAMRSDEVEKVFSELKSFLPNFVNEVIAKQKKVEHIPILGSFSVPAQKDLGLELMKLMGFNFSHGRLDVSHHPFCGGVPDDVRLTTRYSEDDFAQSFMGVAHETGHALYEQNLPKQWREQLVGQSGGMTVHESQSLFWEMQICRSREFISYMAPLMQKAFPQYAKSPMMSAENLYRHYTLVEKSLIRVDADEVTYPLHIILRFEIEKSFMEGQIQVKDIPSVWNEKMQKYLGLSTDGDYKNGCLQDVHWPSGAIGYFPAYTYGAMMAAQLFAAYKKTQPQVYHELQNGHTASIQKWLGENIWSQGRLLDTRQLLEKATGEKLNAKYFIEHLKYRYGG